MYISYLDAMGETCHHMPCDNPEHTPAQAEHRAGRGAPPARVQPPFVSKGVRRLPACSNRRRRDASARASNEAQTRACGRRRRRGQRQASPQVDVASRRGRGGGPRVRPRQPATRQGGAAAAEAGVRVRASRLRRSGRVERPVRNAILPQHLGLAPPRRRRRRRKPKRPTMPAPAARCGAHDLGCSAAPTR